MNAIKTLLCLGAIAGLSACEQKFKFKSLDAPRVVSGTPEVPGNCQSATPRIVGSRTVEVDQLTDLFFPNAERVNWYILFPDGERIFQGERLAITVSQTGSFPATVWGYDSCNNRHQENFELTVVPALKDPSVLINHDARFTTEAEVDLQLSVVGADQMYVTRDSACLTGGAWEAYSAEKTWTLLDESADARVYVKYKNAARESICVSDAIIYDKTPPELQFVKVPPAQSYQSRGEFKFDVVDKISGVKHIECSLNGAQYSVCEAESVFENLRHGVYNLKARASDLAGNISEPIEYTWSYLNARPTVQITSAPVTGTIETRGAFEFTGSDESGPVVRFDCWINDDPIINCHSPLHLDQLATGQNEFKVVAYDQFGLDSIPATHQWWIEVVPPPRVPPQVFLTQNPDAKTYDLNPRFGFDARHSGVGIKHFFCSIDGGKEEECASPKMYTLSPGTHEFSVRAVDNDGLTSEKLNFSWTIEKLRVPYQDRFTIDSNGKKLDVLIVIDNSPSMTEEQKKMSSRFKTFRDSLSDVDWQIGIISTDARDGSKAWQGGKLIPFEGLNSTYSITAKTPRVDEVFAKTIQRKEWGSSKEEGIHALNKAITRGQNRFFFRDNSHVAAIVVSDEDEKSNGSKLEKVNEPAHLVNQFQSIFEGKNTFSGHAIVLLKEEPSRRNCKQVGDFAIGSTYMKLAELTGGAIGDLCADDYGPTLKAIAENLRSKTYSVELRCAPTEAPKVRFHPAVATTPSLELKGRFLSVSPYPPVGTQVEIEYFCD